MRERHECLDCGKAMGKWCYAVVQDADGTRLKACVTCYRRDWRAWFKDPVKRERSCPAE